MACFMFPSQEVPEPPVLANFLLRHQTQFILLYEIAKHTVHDHNKFTVCNCLKCTEDEGIEAVPFLYLYNADVASVLFLGFFALTV